ncbi:MAG: RNA polymerase sigma-54 factor, partial [Phaeodactylibacter sp.]|nr:RNA polymerase sigma-54 factor [Phaeodactylibacter sp.]
REDAYELDDYLNDYIEDDPASYKLRSNNYSTEEEDKSIPIPVESSFHDYLEQQLGLQDFGDERLEAIAHQIIGSIDDDGYLRREPIAIMDDLMFSQNIFVTKEEIVEVLKKIQRFDPPGIGARDLQECLLLQLYNKRDQEELEDMSLEEWDSLELAIEILKNHFDEFTKKHYLKLQNRLNITEEDLKGAIDEIVKLNPKPASGYSSSGNRSTQYIVPDFIIVNRDG